ncbi:MAG: gamma-glutamyltransferase, partial [Deltaproteobacteria bacterium]|nr:gamma-glutamyltransferase [Deltaproteobacteria bacterium]
MDHNFSESLTTRKAAVVSSKGIVASQHKLASRAGARVLAEGGNAVDAAVATAFTVSVLEPWMSGIGGGGHMLIHDAPSGKVHAIDFGMRSPGGLDPADYPLSGEGVASDLFPWPRVVEDRNIIGATSIAVPGQVDGMRVALENFGSRSWSESLQPAIRAAEAGMQIDWYATLLIG